MLIISKCLILFIINYVFNVYIVACVCVSLRNTALLIYDLFTFYGWFCYLLFILKMRQIGETGSRK